MKLSIVIPALNEEKSIESIIIRSLDAIPFIINNSQVTSVEITVVSDGSTDNTVTIASRYSDRIKLIVFEKNKGYGAAIKEGWRQSDADLLGFLDADGTCDPKFFVNLCNLIDDKKADIALGSRLNKNSEMPVIRRIGNTMYSLLLSMISFEKINDTASGMRVIKKESLHKIMPLPDGLHFTPAMSARAILSQDLKIVEENMTYHEREGQSKLKVFRDGIRFLKIIFKMIFLYQPYKILSFFSVIGFLLCLLLMLNPIGYYLRNSRVEEWMIYRFIVCDVISVACWLILSAAYLTKKIISITLSQNDNISKGISNIFNRRYAIWISVICFILGTLLIYHSFIQRITTGVTFEHWSRFIAMSFFYSTTFIFIATRLIDYVLSLIRDRLNYLRTII